MRLITGAIAGLVLVGSTTYVAQADGTRPGDLRTADVQQVEPVDVGTAAVPAAPQEAAADVVAELPRRRTDDFNLVGVTWRRGFDDAGLSVQVRLRADGAWGTWEELHVDSDGGEGGRDGTEPLWAGDADGVAVRVSSPTGQRPAGLSVSTIDPGTSPAESANAGTALHDTSAGAVTQVADGSPSYTARPAIVRRSTWGARRSSGCDSPRRGNETRGVVVHHTAGTNSYSASQSASIVRAVQAYHMKARDWCDIGYNFLVDRYGRIFEGRSGGIDKAVRGAHAGDKGVNTYTMGVSMMGTFSSSRPTAAAQAAMVRLVGWRLGTTFHSATGRYRVGSHRLQRIAGHRNVVSTACPGQAAYTWLGARGGLRDRVAAYVADYRSAIKTRATKLTRSVTGPVKVGEYPFSSGASGRKARLRRLDLYSSRSGTFSVAGRFRREYAAVGEQSGVLGVPRGRERATSRSRVRLQRFAHGTIYQVRRTSTRGYAVWGPVDARYRALGREKGALGAPTRRMARISGNRYRAWFAHGHITREAGGSVTVSRT
ncbi:N-acetylmuramoyl-L-alanine amidase [Aeromicrobium chenweiae]|uniref:N-acetylmuramoyl-L-alanine amidase n=1 Tax=Aeromicrobium chenweiae TaxID=2079793 RepID=A0A2S0WPE7_9ACTN|nr:N-acetylmuramoyl-L-alanine amidase [Aeromicrobium chenweiae]AWB93219.1 hypothetical protein C3E78_13965 [Aeromicrobium chenweiae]TGN34211.1 hypothetical protein E4L97_04000 [Aeromicrobium chenweiae]